MMPLLRWTGNPVDMAVFSLMRGRQIFQQKESFPKPSLPPTALCPSVLCSWSCAAFPSSTQGKGWGNLPGKGEAAVHCSAEAGMKQRGSGQESHRLVSLPEFPIWSYHTYLESTRERQSSKGESENEGLCTPFLHRTERLLPDCRELQPSVWQLQHRPWTGCSHLHEEVRVQ